ncbi:MAG: S41 family peptidase [Candidatus Omnitrophica bacterium]|nr:S41 family peptidase [Candidatus Omnitrophota bacterium]MDD5518511.1 S41 family peptidase [Candidatus Omnitrophota bacterium]
MRKRLFIVFIIAVLFFSSASLAISLDRKTRDELYRQVQLFSDALAAIETDYVDEVKAKDLIYGALKGMLSSLDPHSQFMDPDTYNELKVDTEGKFGGLGIEISLKDGQLTIITPLEDTPAWQAGLKPGDRIVKINNELTRGIDLSGATKKLRGKPGEAVTLTILRESTQKILEFKIVRAMIKINDIKEAKILTDGIGYIRLVEFRENTPKDFKAAVQKLSRFKMDALILDLRNNPGGLLESALEITGEFVPEGKLIAYTQGRKADQNMRFISKARSPILNLPLVVLINQGSASGSEIIAGALQDYKRATILGVKSFGKGSVQTVIPLSDGSALRLTTSKYFTPSGKEIHGKGVTPDIVLDVTPQGASGQELLEEAGLSNHPAKNKAPWDYKTDPQVMAAINLLK